MESLIAGIKRKIFCEFVFYIHLLFDAKPSEIYNAKFK